MPDVNHVSITFGNGVKREEYGPTKRAEVTIAAAIGDGEDYGAVIDLLTSQAIAKVAFMLDAPKPTTVAVAATEPALEGEQQPPKRRPGRPPKDTFSAQVAESASDTSASVTPASTASAEATPGPQQSSQQSGAGAAPAPASQPPSDDWSGSAPEISDEQILKATSAKAQEHGNDPEFRKKISLLIGTFDPNNGQGPQFKVQSIGQPQRQDYLTKLAALG